MCSSDLQNPKTPPPYNKLITIHLKYIKSTLNNLFEVVFGCFDVSRNKFFFDGRVAHNDHNIRGAGELINVGRETLVANSHALELVVSFNAAQLELLNDVRDFLEPMDIFVVLLIMVSYNKESASLKQDSLVGTYSRAEFL